MKALIFQAPHEAVVTEIDDPQIGPDEVLVKSHAVGICHSDFELYEGRYIIPVSYPIIPGHEWSGEVVEERAVPPLDGLAHAIDLEKARIVRPRTASSGMILFFVPA
jgi:L-iditol 2-dehydrogenase